MLRLGSTEHILPTYRRVSHPFLDVNYSRHYVASVNAVLVPQPFGACIQAPCQPWQSQRSRVKSPTTRRCTPQSSATGRDRRRGAASQTMAQFLPPTPLRSDIQMRSLNSGPPAEMFLREAYSVSP